MSKSELPEGCRLYLRPGPCVYFLLLGEEVVYVGQTTALGARVEQHRRRITFDAVHYLSVALPDLDRVEREWIERLMPRENYRHVRPYREPHEVRIGRRIRVLRRRAGIRRKHLAAMLGVNEKTMEDWEAGRGTPGDRRVAVLEGIFRLRPGSLTAHYETA